MKTVFFVLFLFLLVEFRIEAQVSISADGSLPDASAGMEVKFTGKGILIPRMTYEQRNAITDPEEGLIIYCTNCSTGNIGTVCLFSNGYWNTLDLCFTSSPVAGPLPTTACGITWNWNKVEGAAGYKWNIVNSYDSATELGIDTSTTETGLTCGIIYTRYVWAYSSCGPSESIILSKSIPCISCGQTMTDCRDGKTYSTVQIGTQCWMAENLNAGIQRNGSVTQTNNGIIEKYCHGNYESRCGSFGGLYQWGECMEYASSSNSNPSGRQGICPAGWHLPSDAEWWQLTNYLGGSALAGGKMKQTGYSYWNYPNTGATNSSGFSARAGGYYSGGSFNNFMLDGLFWTTTESSSTNAWIWLMAYDSESEFRYAYAKQDGFSVRCVKD